VTALLGDYSNNQAVQRGEHPPPSPLKLGCCTSEGVGATAAGKDTKRSLLSVTTSVEGAAV